MPAQIINKIYVTDDSTHLGKPGQVDITSLECPLRDIAASMHNALQTGDRVMVYLGDDQMPLAILAYLIDYVGMKLPNAYVLLSLRMGTLKVDCMPLIEAYRLPFDAESALPANLLDHSRQEISAVDKGLYLSGILALDDQPHIRALGIRAVLRLDLDTSRQWAHDFVLLHLPIPDGEPVHPMILRQGTAFIHRHRQQGHNVLVHCHMGVSRSVTFVLAYLIEFRGMTLAEAYTCVLVGRPLAYPHAALLRALISTYDLPEDGVNSDGFLDRLLEAVAYHKYG